MLLQALTSRNSILLIVLLAVTISYSACNSAQVPTGVGPQVVAPSPPVTTKMSLFPPFVTIRLCLILPLVTRSRCLWASSTMFS